MSKLNAFRGVPLPNDWPEYVKLAVIHNGVGLSSRAPVESTRAPIAGQAEAGGTWLSGCVPVGSGLPGLDASESWPQLAGVDTPLAVVRIYSYASLPLSLQSRPGNFNDAQNHQELL